MAMSDQTRGLLGGLLAGTWFGFLGGVVAFAIQLDKHPIADIGVHFTNSAQVATLRVQHRLPESLIKGWLETAFENYRDKKYSIVEVKLPPDLPKP